MRGLLLLAVVLALAVPPAGAAPRRFSLAHTLTAPVPEDDAYFGWSVAPYGDDLLVGALLVESENGVVYLIDIPTNTVLRTFAPPPNGALDFGFAIAVVGGTVVVGAPAQRGGTPASGAAYVFDAETGALLRTLSQPGGGSEFGYCVAALGDNVLVSTRWYGAVYLYDGATGALLQTFTNPGFGTDSFGHSIAALGPNVLIGAPHASFAAYSGVAYLFDGATGALLRTFTNPTTDPNDGFGQTVGVLGGEVLVGDPYDNTDAGSTGQVHRFDPLTGGFLMTYHSPAGPSGTFGYGTLVEFDGDLLAGAPGAQAGAGAAFVVDGQTGAFEARLAAPVAGPDDLVGYAVATTGTYAVVQAPYADDPVEDVGIVYLFEPCGSGVVAGDEECDDGNTVDGDGCSSLCFVEPCTPVPPACREPAAARLTLKEGSKDVLTWRWRGGGSSLPDFGDPTASSHYELCIYDGSGAAQPRFARTIPAGETCDGKPCWQAATGGFEFKNSKSVPGGIAKLSLKADAQGTGKLALKGQGPDLAPPALPLTPPVVVQLHNVDNGVCWGGQYSNPSRNEPGKFSARSD